jgi:hypothetical protein
MEWPPRQLSSAGTRIRWGKATPFRRSLDCWLHRLDRPWHSGSSTPIFYSLKTEAASCWALACVARRPGIRRALFL